MKLSIQAGIPEAGHLSNFDGNIFLTGSSGACYA